MMLIPCRHSEHVTRQIEPTIELLSTLDREHPDILRNKGVAPEDYHGGLVFRSAIESIRGSFIASSVTGREAMVGHFLANLLQRNQIQAFRHTGNESRYDFEVILNGQRHAAIEVKGGEGNSINITNRPIWANEFAVWCHLDGAIVNQPAKGVRSIINRITNALVRDAKQVDVLIFKDALCGTRARPCPKYRRDQGYTGMRTAPDIFLMPQRIPTFSIVGDAAHDPAPPVHTLDTLHLPRLILGLFDVPREEMHQHVWEVQVEILPVGDYRLKRVVRVNHQGEPIGEFASKSWLR